MLPLIDAHSEEGSQAAEAMLDRLRGTAAADSEAAATVAALMADVCSRGDAAVVEAMQKFTDPEFSEDTIRVSADDIEAAQAGLPEDLRKAIEASIRNVQAYQSHVMPQPVEGVELDGATLGMRWTPVDSVGLCVPGGTAELVSTLIMLAVPAIVAGVKPESISVMSPPPTRREGQPAGDISKLVLAACGILGIEKAYRIGGAQGVAAMGFGTHTVEPVDLIAGPGNVYVQLAKAQLGAACGTDNGFYGPSEITVVADATAHADRIAADLIAQAEHDPGKCFFIAWEQDIIDRVLREIETQMPERNRQPAIRNAFANDSCILKVAGRAEAIQWANRLACEHLTLAVSEPREMLGHIRHAGEVFLGDPTPVAAGDYIAGPSHCLPTGTTARFTSGVSVYTFLKRTGTVAYPHGMSAQTIEHISNLSTAESLDGHAASARIRS
jgi:histidinol dehydrogenase